MFTFKKEEKAQFWTTLILITKKKKTVEEMLKNRGVSSSRHFFIITRNSEKIVHPCVSVEMVLLMCVVNPLGSTYPEVKLSYVHLPSYTYCWI